MHATDQRSSRAVTPSQVCWRMLENDGEWCKMLENAGECRFWLTGCDLAQESDRGVLGRPDDHALLSMAHPLSVAVSMAPIIYVYGSPVAIWRRRVISSRAASV